MATDYAALISQAEHMIRELELQHQLELDPRKQVKLAAKALAIAKQLVRLRERKLAIDKRTAPARARKRAEMTRQFDRVRNKMARARED